MSPDRTLHQGALAEPWLLFLKGIDDQLNEEIALHCMGGFAAVQAYGLERATAEMDVIAVLPAGTGSQLVALAGKESALRARYGVYLDVVTLASVPEAYESRLGALYDGSWRNLRLFVLEPACRVLDYCTSGNNRLSLEGPPSHIVSGRTRPTPAVLATSLVR